MGTENRLYVHDYTRWLESNSVRFKTGEVAKFIGLSSGNSTKNNVLFPSIDEMRLLPQYQNELPIQEPDGNKSWLYSIDAVYALSEYRWLTREKPSPLIGDNNKVRFIKNMEILEQTILAQAFKLSLDNKRGGEMQELLNSAMETPYAPIVEDYLGALLRHSQTGHLEYF